MNKERAFKQFLLAVGSLMVAGGATVAGIHAVEGSYLKVFSGYFLFVLGYKTSWLGTHSASSFWALMEKIKDGVLVDHLISNLWHYCLTVLGVLMMSYGTTMFAQIILQLEAGNTVIAGALTFGGYMVAHVGVNEVLV